MALICLFLGGSSYTEQLRGSFAAATIDFGFSDSGPDIGGSVYIIWRQPHKAKADSISFTSDSGFAVGA